MLSLRDFLGGSFSPPATNEVSNIIHDEFQEQRQQTWNLFNQECVSTEESDFLTFYVFTHFMVLMEFGN